MGESDKALALYLTELAVAGEDCRIKHGCLARWARGEDVAGDERCRVGHGEDELQKEKPP